MPIYCYKCPDGHSMEVFQHKPKKRERGIKCKTCGKKAGRDIVAEHTNNNKVIHINPDNETMSHMFTKRSFKGAVLEHLGPVPIRVTSKAQYDRLLRQTKSAESKTGYNGR